MKKLFLVMALHLCIACNPSEYKDGVTVEEKKGSSSSSFEQVSSNDAQGGPKSTPLSSSNVIESSSESSTLSSNSEVESSSVPSRYIKNVQY